MRLVPGLGRLVKYDDENRPVFTLLGDLAGGMVWAEEPNRRDHVNAWFLTGAPVYSNTTEGTATKKDWSLQFDATEPDERLESKDLATPEWFKGKFPKSHPGLASAAVKEDEQVDLLHPSFFGLFAPQVHGPASTGTYVYDLDDESKPDPDRAFQLQQLLRVADIGPGRCGFSGVVPALQLGVEDLEGKSGGLPFAEGKATGLGSALAGGPFAVGAGQCQHAGAGPDGHVGPLHLHTGSLFLGLEHDGPLHFEPDPVDWQGMRDEGVMSRVHLAWEPALDHVAGCGRGKGQWVWYTRQPSFIGDPGGGKRKREVIEDGFERVRRGGDGEQYVLIDYFERVTEDTDTVPFIKDPCTGMEPRDQVCVSDGGKPVMATSPYMQAAPGFMFKAQDATKGATLAKDDPCNWFHTTPNVVQMVAYGSQSGGEFSVTQSDSLTHTTGQGGFMILPPDVDPYAVFRGESVSSAYTPQLVIPNGLAQLGFGTVGTNGLAQSGMVMEVGTGGRLDIKTVDSTGAVTATAYIPSGASGDISGAAGSGDVTGPAGATAGNLPQLDATGKILSDSGVAAADVVTGPGSATDTELTLFSGATGKVVSGGSGITVSSGSAVFADVKGLRFAPALGGVPTGLSGGYGLYSSSEGLTTTQDLMYEKAGTQLEVPVLDTSTASANQVVSVNGTATGWTLVDKSTLAGAFNDLSDVTITSVAQYEYPTYNGSAWVNQDYADFRATAAGGGYANVKHRIQDDVSLSTATAQTMHDALVVSCPSNYSGTYTGGTGILFEGYNGQDLGDIGFVRSGASTARFAIRTVLGAGISPDVWVRNESSQVSLAITGTGILALKDTATGATKYQTWGSGYGHIYVVDGQLHYTDDTNTRHTITGAATVQADLNNADNVNTATTTSGEVLVYNGSTFDATDRFTSTSASGDAVNFVTRVEEVVNASAGGTIATSSSLIPACAVVTAVVARVTTGFGTSNGLTSVDLARTSNVGTDVDELGTLSALTSGTTHSSNCDATTAAMSTFWAVGSSADGITLTGNGGTGFDATGAIRIVVYYFLATAPTS